MAIASGADVALSLEEAMDPFDPLLQPHEAASLFAANVAGMDPNLISGGSAQFAVQAAVPVPAATWLFGSGLLGLIGLSKRKKTA